MKSINMFCLLLLLCVLPINAQSTYLILTSTPDDVDIGQGMFKRVRPLETYQKSPTIFFTLYSQGKFDYDFIHRDYNVEEAQRQLPYYRPDPEYDNHEIIMKPKSFLNEIEPVDLDVLFPTWTEADVEAFCDSLHRKKVYIIDRNDITNDSINLIEVRYFRKLEV